MSGSPPARRDGLLQGTDGLLRQVLSQALILRTVGLDQAPVDAPGGLGRGAALVGEQGLEMLGLGAGEQVDSGA